MESSRVITLLSIYIQSPAEDLSPESWGEASDVVLEGASAAKLFAGRKTNDVYSIMYIANIADVNCPVQLPEGASVKGLGVSISNLLGLFAKS